MHKLIKKSIAKINLGLFITEKRDDGFHNLETIFYPINDLFDLITFEKSSEYSFSSNTELKFDESNLIYRAVKSLEKETGKKLPVSIYLEKKIPFGGGLGGGSSNAATTLMGMNKLYHLDLEEKVLRRIALQLGSDVPYFLLSKPALAKGRGEILMPIDIKIKGIILIINPDIHISTKEAFSQIRPRKRSIQLSRLTENNEFNCGSVAETLSNDFEKYVFNKYQEISSIKEAMLEKGAKLASMSGTGSTVYGVFNSIHQAMLCSSDLPSHYKKFVSYDHG